MSGSRCVMMSYYKAYQTVIVNFLRVMLNYISSTVLKVIIIVFCENLLLSRALAKQDKMKSLVELPTKNVMEKEIFLPDLEPLSLQGVG